MQDRLSTGDRDRVESVIVVGGGSAGWMAATYLARVLSRQTRITLVESSEIGVVGVGEATIPPIRTFNRFVGVDEQAFLRDTQGSFKIGIEFENWGAIGENYLHPFGVVGREMDAVVKLHHWWRLGLSAGEPDYPAWEDVYLARAAADRQAFQLPGPPAGNPGQRLIRAYHFDAVAYGRHLRELAMSRGVERVEGTIEEVERDGESGNVSTLVLEDGRRLSADFFVDCSGFRSLLLGGALEEPFDDWSHWLPADRALAVPSERSADGILPITRSIAHPVGWQWRIPLQHRTGNGHVFASSFSSESEAEERLLATLDTPPIDSPRLIRFRTGRRQRSWVNNVVGLGLAAGFLEPLESTSIHLVQSGIERLVGLFPSRHMDPALRDRFNAQSQHEWSQVRDFIIAHYKVTRRDDSEFWRYCASMEIPDSLAQVLDLWGRHGILGVDGGHLFQLGSWAAILIGQGLVPQVPHALTDRLDPGQAAADIRAVVAAVRRQAATMPAHDQFLAQYAPAPAGAGD